MRLEWIGLGAERSFESQVCASELLRNAHKFDKFFLSSDSQRTYLFCTQFVRAEWSGAKLSSELIQLDSERASERASTSE